jgi:hypothetical protein
MNNLRRQEREENVVFSRTIKAGKRVYYLDVRRNRRDELFVVLTESRKITDPEDESYFQLERNKIFLYKEDFDPFITCLIDVVEFVNQNNTVRYTPFGNMRGDDGNGFRE